MDKPTCLAYITNEHLRPKLVELFQAKKIDLYLIKEGDQVAQLVKSWSPFMILIDLTGPESEWLFKHIANIQMVKPGFPVIAFITPDQDAVRQRAESYGCRFVFKLAELLKKLPLTIENVLTRGF